MNSIFTVFSLYFRLLSQVKFSVWDSHLFLSFATSTWNKVKLAARYQVTVDYNQCSWVFHNHCSWVFECAQFFRQAHLCKKKRAKDRSLFMKNTDIRRAKVKFLPPFCDLVHVQIVVDLFAKLSGVRSMGPSLSNWVRDLWLHLTDVTLADEDTNSILTDNANRAIQGNVTMHVMQPGGQICNICKCRHLMANFGTNTRGATWWPNFEGMHVVTFIRQISWFLNINQRFTIMILSGRWGP